MLNIQRQAFTKYLSSVVLLLVTFSAGEVKQISLGMILLQTVEIQQDGSSTMAPGIVVRLVNKATKAETFAITDKAGFAEVPARPGAYCYDAYSNKGQRFAAKRRANERCFEVKVSEDTEVGVEFLK